MKQTQSGEGFESRLVVRLTPARAEELAAAVPSVAVALQFAGE